MKSLHSRAIVYGLVILLGLLSALPNLLPVKVLDKLPGWYQQHTISLGLDLQGGSHLLLAADFQELIASERDAVSGEVTTLLREAGIRYGRLQITNQDIQIPVHRPEKVSEAASLARKLATQTPDGSRRFEVDTNGRQLILTLSESWKERVSRDAVERSLEVVRRRLNETGLVEPSITRQGSDGILVQMPGVADPREIRELLGTTAKLTFHWAAGEGAGQDVTAIVLPGTEENTDYRVEKRIAMAGEHIRDAHMAFNPDTNEPVVTFELDDKGARLFGGMTRDNIGRALAIVLDGEVIAAPVIRSAIFANGEISGGFTTKEASNLALLLRAGALPAPLNLIEERTVGPDLGSDAIAMGLTTGLLGAAMVFAFMVGLYGRWGLIACLGLTVNIGLIFGVLSMLGATLTLPGIAGIVLTIGMAVDANILINERIREESRLGRPAWMALREGFGKAYKTILDSNVTTLIAVSLLFLFGSGPVRGFAVTIGIGLGTSLFTAIAVTRLMMEWYIRGSERQPLVIAGIRRIDRLGERGMDFMRGRIVGLIVSAVLSITAIALFVHPGLKYGVDFTGGTVVQIQTHGVAVEQLRTTLLRHDLASAAIQEAGTDGHFLIRLPAEQGAQGDKVELLKTAVTFVDPNAEFPKVDMVGPKVSGDFSDATILAILLAGVGMLGYLWVRFESHFAWAAILTIALDITKTIGFFVLAGVEFNLTAVAALLALIGYSVNDKVVVFDRIRENLRKTPGRPLLELLNDSISSTLTRTLFTSATTFLALLPMGIAGGAAVASFVLPMLFGIVIGTSSSVFIASPILYYLGERRNRRGLAQLRPSAEEIRRELELIP